MAETDLHRDLIVELIETLKAFFAGKRVYVSGNILLFYRPGNNRRCVSPDVFVTKELEMRKRENYLLWEKGVPPNVVIEITSRTTRDEDLADKFEIYRDEIKVQEYFLFDPQEEYLQPSMQGFRLVDGQYVRIDPIDGRLPTQELGLHLVREGTQLRLIDPMTGERLPTPAEEIARPRSELEAIRRARGNA